jgi:hypothetical protein
MVFIEFGHRRTRLNDEVMLLWFPRLLFLGRVDGDQLVKELDRHISQYAHENVETETIRDYLQGFFGRFESMDCRRTEWVYDTLNHNLRRTVYDRTKHLGRKECRQQFLVLAYLSGYVSSKRLAEVLTRFLSKDIKSVVCLEQPFYLREWGFAIHELCGLVYEPILLHLASHFTRPGLGYGWAPPSFRDPREEMVRKAIADVQRQQVANHYRGRRHNRFFVPSAWVRTRSAPALPHCHRVVGVPLPQMSHTALPFREYYDDLDYFDDVDDFEDVDEVLFQQQIQAAEVDRLERRVRRLELEGR